MTYKNKKVLKDYKHQWYINKKKGLPTNLKGTVQLKLNKKERKERESLWRKKSNINQQIKRKAIRNKYLKNRCFFCSYNQEFRRLITHRKDGKKHTKFNNMTNQKYLEEMKSKQYVLLCSLCHKHVHWCMDYLGMKWEEIYSRYKSARSVTVA
jgi:hypothetical protein